MFGFIRKTLSSIYTQFTSKVRTLFTRSVVDQETLHELEKILISSDTGISTTRTIITNLKAQVANGSIAQGSDLHKALGEQLVALLKVRPYDYTADIYLLVGINGSGKTTFAGKLGFWLKGQHKKVLFIAGDTFRAAATEQLNSWGQKIGIPVVIGKEHQDPASVVFAGCEQFKTGDYSALIIDTAGRLQTKVNLMKELEKIKRSIEKQLPGKKIATLLTIDAMLGQNSFEQAKIFNESTHVDGLILTKMDGTGKGGIVFSIIQELQIPVAFISYGEQPEQLSLFNPEQYVTDLLSE
ncbi:signal recognition particle-docking protein FtsY [Candidatus Dependentiae bacterium]|nr:signal recognition particle-docking protein FtsY [Candidatus Dependentiae bacterium]